jgi:hypothetical protein
VRQRKNRLLPWGEEKIDYRREAKKKSIIAVRRELPSGRMKLILAVRQRKINYRREAKKKSISPWGLNRRQADEIDFCREAKKNWLSPWGEEKIDYRHEAKKKSIIAVRQRKNRLSPWGEEKIDYRREAKKNWYHGKEKSAVAESSYRTLDRHRGELNKLWKQAKWRSRPTRA